MDWLKEFVPKDEPKDKPQPSQVGQSGSSSQVNQPKPKPTKKAAKKANSKITPVAAVQTAKGEGTSTNDEEKDQTLIHDDKVEDQICVAETYFDYKPAKLTFGAQHPDEVVETASLSSVSPCDITYKLVIPEKTIKSGSLSALQLESIIYASQAHEQFLEDGSRAGFLIGDGAGVGKGRTIAGIIYENWLRGRKQAIWVSVSSDLKYDAERDLNDIGAGIEVHALNKFKYAKINSATNGRVSSGVIYSTYASLISGTKNAAARYNTRLKQLVDWVGSDYDGCIVFDECHKAKHLVPAGGMKPTKTGMCVLELQKQLPKARIVYASATGASEPRNMAYMVRLGLWGKGTPFKAFPEFLTTLDKRGVGAMEIVAMDMKLRGMYIARQLSFKGVSFRIDDVQLTDEFKKMYNDSVELWVQARRNFDEASILLDRHPKLIHTMWANFYSGHQRFFKYLCIAAKVKHAVKLAKKAVNEEGKCVVIGLQSTGEARTLDVLERDNGELTDFISTAKSAFDILIENHFPAPQRGYWDDLQNQNHPEIKEKSPKQMRTRNVSVKDLKRKVLADLDIGRAKKKTRVFSSSDESDVDEKKVKSEPNVDVKEVKSESNVDEKKIKLEPGTFDLKRKASSSIAHQKKKPRVVYTSDESDEDEKKVKSESNVDKKKIKSEPESDDAQSSGDEDMYQGESNSSESDSDSASEFESFSSDSDTQDESEISSDSDSNFSDEESDYDSDYAMETVRGRSATGLNKRKTMQEKIHFILLEQSKQVKGRSAEILQSYCNRACDLKDDLLERIEELGARLPPNTLDQLIDELGGSSQVAEMTGRKGRVVQSRDDEIQYESRAESGVSLEKLNLIEKQRFMDGDKLIAIISEAASNGISLHADRRFENKLQRVHITLELAWSADACIQQFGRTHRSNQVSAPEYIFLISELAGERRFASSVSKRLESLGALTHADRRATETRNLSQFNIDNKYGREALQKVLKQILIGGSELDGTEDEQKLELFGDLKFALADVGIGGDPIADVKMSRFLNRILGLPVDLQNQCFEFFCNTLDEIIAREKKAGKYDMGIQDLGNTDTAVKIRSTRFTRTCATGTAPIEVTTVALERGISWEEALKKFEGAKNDYEGFYITKHVRNNNQSICLALAVNDVTNAQMRGLKGRSFLYQTFRPHTGAQSRFEPFDEVLRKGNKSTNMERIQHYWEHHYESSATKCSHVFWNGRCINKKLGYECDEGMRRRKYTVISGSIFAVWNRIEAVLRKQEFYHTPRVIRLQTTDGSKICGVLVPGECVEDLLTDLHLDSDDFEEIIHSDK